MAATENTETINLKKQAARDGEAVKFSRKIYVTKASAREIRESLGITPSEAKVAAKAIQRVSRSAKATSGKKHSKGAASKRTKSLP